MLRDQAASVDLVYRELGRETRQSKLASGNGHPSHPSAIGGSRVQRQTSLAMRDDEVVPKRGNRLIALELPCRIVFFGRVARHFEKQRWVQRCSSRAWRMLFELAADH